MYTLSCECRDCSVAPVDIKLLKLFVTTSLGKKLILPMFQLDSLVLLKAR